MIALPSLRSLDQGQGIRIWLAADATDMRCGFDRLAERVKAVISQDQLSGHLFVFGTRRAIRLKVLTWDGDGYALWYKRLEAGLFKIPRPKQPARSSELRASELAMIVDGHCPNDMVVWVNTKTGVYHFRGERWYGAKKEGNYECRKEANVEGDRAVRNGQ